MTLTAIWDIFNTILFWVLVYCILWNAYIPLFNGRIPNIRTAPAIRKRCIALLKQDAAARGKKPYVVYDLGSGNGLFTRQIARALPDAKVTGFEISKPALYISRSFAKILGLKNLRYAQESFYDANLSGADAIVMYLTVTDMPQIGKKLTENLKPGTLILSNKYKPEGWVPVESIDVRTLYPHQKTLHVYRKQA